MATKTLNVRMQQLSTGDISSTAVPLKGELVYDLINENITFGNGATASANLRSLSFIPIGTVIMKADFLGIDGFLHCNGRAMSRTVYNELFKVISTKYGAGDGSTTFNIPNLVDRMPYFTVTSSQVGKTAGLSSIVLTEAQMPNHRHGFMLNVNHDDGVKVNEEALAIGLQYPGWRRYNGNTDYTGSGQGHDNMPPYTRLTPFIKY